VWRCDVSDGDNMSFSLRKGIRYIFPFAFLLFIATGLDPWQRIHAEPDAKRKADLARVSILSYQDLTGSKNFGYMPASLTEAIDESLRSRFEYIREEPAKSEVAAMKYRASGLGFTPETAAEFCKINKTDILILGSFTFDAQKNEIVVQTWISLGATNKFRNLPDRRNLVNATIFKLADKVADDIVQALTEIAKEQTPEKSPDEKRPKGKIELKKEKPESRIWATAGFPYVKSLPFPNNSNPTLMVADGPPPLDAMRGFAFLELGVSPGRFQLPAGILWSLATQYFYGRGDFPQVHQDPAVVNLLSMGGGLRFDRPFMIGGWYGISPVVGFYVHYQRFFRSFGESSLNAMALVPEIGINQYIRLGAKENWRLMLSVMAGGFFYNLQNLSYLRVSVGVEYGYR
jgi:hypothetical protein